MSGGRQESQAGASPDRESPQDDGTEPETSAGSAPTGGARDAGAVGAKGPADEAPDAAENDATDDDEAPDAAENDATEDDSHEPSEALDHEGPAPPAEPADEANGDDGSEHEPLRSPLDANGFERPVFLLDFPLDDKLEPLIEAFENGNYAYVREHAHAVARASDDEAVSNAALELLRRTEPDPLAKFLLALAFALLFFLILWAYLKHSN